MIHTIIKRQKKWIGLVLRGDSLPRTIIKGKTEGKKTSRRPRQMMLDWMIADSYGRLKEEAQQQAEPTHRSLERI